MIPADTELKDMTEGQLQERIKQLETTLQQVMQERTALEPFRQLFLNLPQEVHIWQLEYCGDQTIKTWRLLDINDAALKSWRKLKNDVIGKAPDDIFQTNATEHCLPIINKIFTEKKPYHWEDYIISTDQYLGMTSIPLDGYFISVGVDISNIKKQELAHQHTILKLQEAITAGNIGLWEWDLATNACYFSKEWKAQLGFSEYEINNDFEEWRKRVHPEDLPAVEAKVRTIIDTRQDTHEVEFRMRHKDGSYRWIMAHASLLLNTQGEPERMVGSHIDITKQKRMEDTVLQHQKMQALGTLAGGIAHDFNNLLTPMLGYTHMLKPALQQHKKESHYVEQIEQAALRAKDLVQQILFVSRTSTNPVAQIEPVYLSAVLDEISVLLKTTTHQNIKVSVKNEQNVPAIGANSSQVHRIILNLCNNAIQAMPHGGELSISLYQSQECLSDANENETTDCVCLSISDTGTGISPAMQQRIFEPFFTTKDKGQIRGTGLGLAIVDTVMQQHGGKVTLQSELGVGSVFTLYFPIIPIGFESQAQTPIIDKCSSINRIMLIDDESPLCELGAIILTDLGYEVSTFQHAGQALEHVLAKPKHYDLIITDYGMPEMSGAEFVQQLRHHGITTPVLVITGFTNMVNEVQRTKWQCDGIISKPYKINDLKQAIAQIGRQISSSLVN